MLNRLDHFLLVNKKLYKVILLGLLLFTIEKIIFVCRFGNFSTFVTYSDAIPEMLFNSIRFDLQALAYVLLIVQAINLISLFFSSEKTYQFFQNLSIKLIPVLLVISLLLLIADQQFYSFFKLHFNPVAFDFFDEEPKLLLKSIWQEHPVIKITIITILAYFIIRYLVYRIYTRTTLKIAKINPIYKLTIASITLGFYFLLMRGSLGTFPLQNEDINVSDNEFINACVPNGLFLLKEAYFEAKEEYKLKSPDEILKDYGYNSIKEAFADLKDIPVDSVQSDNIHDLIFTKANGHQDKKYNVVLFIMESMSNHFINFHDKDNNLLGSFESHFQSDIVFRNFQSSGNGTIVTLENILMNVPFHRMFETKYRFNSYDISIAKPFKDAGYKTKFITGIELGWRHLDEVLKRQYFDNVYGKNHLLKNFPEAKCNNTWGVFDHNVFDYIYKVLSEHEEPQFIATLSSTNHTPYELPKNYIPYPIDPKVAENPIFCVSQKRLNEVLTSFQYSNDALGKFMDKIKNSPLAENTVVIITGDHNIRSTILYSIPDLQKLKYSVPLYIYMPDDLKEKLYIDTSRLGSHYDIMTSIFPYLLNDEYYPDLGQNLFDENKPSNTFYSINEEQLLYGEAIDKKDVERKEKARNALLFYYYSSFIQNNKLKNTAKSAL